MSLKISKYSWPSSRQTEYIHNDIKWGRFYINWKIPDFWSEILNSGGAIYISHDNQSLS